MDTPFDPPVSPANSSISSREGSMLVLGLAGASHTDRNANRWTVVQCDSCEETYHLAKENWAAGSLQGGLCPATTDPETPAGFPLESWAASDKA